MTKFTAFSEKQKKVLCWWSESENVNKQAIICDGAVRSGKTLCMSISFVAWAMSCFDNGTFAICGKTITSVRRNIIVPLMSVLRDMDFSCDEKVSKNYIDITVLNHTSRFYLFGGKDEGSASLIQGMTLCGVLFDEVALMPRSFVEQALARCSVTNSKLWFNCNPEYPQHWFYLEWIKKAKQKNALYLHFMMEDNPSLSPEIIKRYKTLYSGAFYDRFVLGKWCSVHGAVYPMFDADKHVVRGELQGFERYVVSCDYGTVNPSSFGLWGLKDNVWYRISEYYYASREQGISRTDEEHYNGLCELVGDRKLDFVTVDPSASSFIECIRRHGKFCVVPADNDVIKGIRQTADCLKNGSIRIHESCHDILREFSLYRWDERGGNDSVVKENDHAMDDMRYFVTAVFGKNSGCDDFFVMSTSRQQINK